MRSYLVSALSLAALAAGTVGAIHADTGPRLPWADPIGVSPTFGTARPTLPYAEPIGASRLNLPRQPITRTPPALRRAPVPTRACYRVRDERGTVVTYCRLVR